MKIFLGWSGDVSHTVAIAFDHWLRKVIQAAKPFISSEDIAKGARWSAQIAKELEASNFGIIFLTSENRNSQWINFEAGALSREIEKSSVVPFLFGLKDTDVSGPLSQFQVVVNEKSDILKLLNSINLRQEPASQLEKGDLADTFELWWPQLESALSKIDREENKKPQTTKRSLEDMVEELLSLVRSQQRQIEPEQMESTLGRALATQALNARIQELLANDTSPAVFDEYARLVARRTDSKLKSILPRPLKDDKT